MLEILTTYAGCSARNKITAVYKNNFYYCSASNLIKHNGLRVCDVILLKDVLNCIISNNEYTAIGDISGNIYVMKDDKIVYESCINKAIQDCCFIREDIAIFCTLYGITVVDLKSDNEYTMEIQYYISSAECYDDILFIGTTTGSLICLEFHDFDTKNLKNNVRNTDIFRIINIYDIHKDRINDIKINDNGLIATGSTDNTIQISRFINNIANNYDLELVQILVGHNDWVNQLCWDGKILYSASADKTIRMWAESSTFFNSNSIGRYETSEIYGSSSEFMGIQVFRGDILGQCQHSSIDYYRSCIDGERLADAKYFASGPTNEVTDLDFNCDMLLCGSRDSITRIFYSGKEVGRPQMHGYEIMSAKFLPTDKLRIVTGAAEPIIRIYEATQVFFMNCEEALQSCQEDICSSDEAIEIIHDRNSSRYFRNCDIETDFSGTANYEEYDNSTEYDGEIIHRSLPEKVKEIMVKDYIKNAKLAELTLSNEVIDDIFDFEGLSVNSLNSSLFKEVSKLYGHHHGIHNIAVNKKFIFSCSESSITATSKLFVWNHDGTNLRMYEGHVLGISRICASDNYVVTVSRDKTTCVYKIDGDDLIMQKKIADHERIIWDCGISRDEKYFATCSRDKVLNLYDLNTNELINTIICETEITALVFSPVSDIIAIGLLDGSVKLLNYSLEILSELVVVGKKVTVMRFNNEGCKIAVGGSDGMVRLLRVNKNS